MREAPSTTAVTIAPSETAPRDTHPSRTNAAQPYNKHAQRGAFVGGALTIGGYKGTECLITAFVLKNEALCLEHAFTSFFLYGIPSLVGAGVFVASATVLTCQYYEKRREQQQKAANERVRNENEAPMLPINTHTGDSQSVDVANQSAPVHNR